MWTADRWQEIERLFDGALAVEPTLRGAWLDTECRGDAALRAQVERMIAADRVSGLLDDAALPEPAADPHVGAIYGAWRLEEKLAEGGVGSIYRSYRVDGAFARPVAVKLLHVGLVSAAIRDRFLREPHFLGRLEHPNIARLLDGGTTPDGIPFVAMELVDGRPIDRFCDSTNAPLLKRVELLIKVFAAVDHAHRALVVHRDLKPMNILVKSDGEPRLIDFGIAALIDTRECDATSANSGAYTPDYAAPEQVRGDATGIASDVWSLGVVAFELITGQRPYTASSVREFAANLRSALPPVRASESFAPETHDVVNRARVRGASPEGLRRRIAGDLDAILARALAPNPAERYANCREFANDLIAWTQHRPVSARLRGPLGNALSIVRRHRVSAALAAALATSLVAGTIVSLWWASEAESRRKTAEIERDVAEEQARHASIEARSGALVAASLTDVFLNERMYPDAASLERAEDRLAEEAATLRRLNADDPHLLANLLDGLGRAAMRVALHNLAESLIREGLELRTRTFGSEDLERALSLGSLGQLHYQRGEFRAARTSLEEAVAIHRRHQGDVHSDLALAVNDLAAATIGCGEYERALELHREALGLRRVADPGSIYVAESLNNVGSALVRIGRLDEAREAIDESVAIRREKLGPTAILTLQSISNRGVLQLRRGDAESARKDLEEAANGMRQLRAAGFEGLSATLPKLAHAAMLQNDVKASEAALNEAEPVVRSLFGDDHPRLADVFEQRAMLARASLDRKAAAANYEEVLRIRRIAFPADHSSLVLTYHNVGIARSDTGDSEGALEALRTCLDARTDDPELDVVTKIGIGTVLVRSSRYAEAEPWLREALAEMPVNEAVHRKAARENLAIVLRNTDREDEAKQMEVEGG